MFQPGLNVALVGAALTGAVVTGVAFASSSSSSGTATAAKATPTTSPTKTCSGVGNQNCATDAKQFTITQLGQLGPLSLNKATSVRIRINNPNAQDIRMLTISASASDPAVPVPRPTPTTRPCTAANDLRITSYTAPTVVTATNQLNVPGNSYKDTTLAVALVDDPAVNQNLCKRATFSLTFAGTAEQVH